MRWTQAQKQLADAKAEADQLRQTGAAAEALHQLPRQLAGTATTSRSVPRRHHPHRRRRTAQAAIYAGASASPAASSYAPVYGAPAYGAPASYGAPPSQTGGFLPRCGADGCWRGPQARGVRGPSKSLMHGFGHERATASDMGFGGFGGGGGRPEEVVTTLR